MKSLLLLIISILSVVANAKTDCEAIADTIPTCAQQCLIIAAASARCGPKNIECQCKNVDAIKRAGQGCVLKACGFDVAKEAGLKALAVCDCLSGSSSTAAASDAPNVSREL